MKTLNGLTVGHVPQFTSKFTPFFISFIAGDEPDIIMITEVIPNAQINPIEAQLLPFGSIYVNFDESATNLGASGIRGVAIYVKEDLYVTDFTDHLWVEIMAFKAMVEIHLSRNDSILCGCIYGSPTKEKQGSLESSKQVCDILAKASKRNDGYLLI